MVSLLTHFVFGLCSIALLVPATHARSFARDLAVPTQLQGTWTSLGCYIDVGRTLTEGGYDDDIGMTDESCIAYCDNLGYHYAGTEYFHECYCGDTLTVGGVPANSGDCNTPCAGDPTEPCGGGNRLSLFWNGVSPPVVNPGEDGWSSIGCYSEGTTGRALQYQYVPPDGSDIMTVDACTAACKYNAYTFAGLEYGDECWCGSDIENGGAPVLDQTGCQMLCTGNGSEYCGGPLLLEMYQFGASTSTSTSQTTSSSASIVSSYSTSSSVASTSTSIISTSSTSSSFQSTTSPTPMPSSVPQTLGIKETVGDYTYQGCYTEGDGVRALTPGVFIDYVGMTLEGCAVACSAYTYFGVEYYGECYCGNSIDPTSGLAPNQADCNFICPGDEYEYCGAGDRLDMYKKGTTSGVSTSSSSISSSAPSSSSVASSSSNASPALPSSSSSVSQSSSSSYPTTTSSSSPSSTSSPASSAAPTSSSTYSSSTSSSDPSSPATTTSSSSLSSGAVPTSSSTYSSSPSSDPSLPSSSSSSSFSSSIPTTTSSYSSSSAAPSSSSMYSSSSSSGVPSSPPSSASSFSSSSPSTVSVCSASTSTANSLIDLGAASTYAVLSFASVTNTGPTILIGDIGTTGTSITGFPPGTFTGTEYISSAASSALTAGNSVYNQILAMTSATVISGNLASQTLGPGLYKYSSSANLAADGVLTLAGTGSPSDIWIFQIGSTLVTGVGSSIVLTNGAQACNVYWQVGSSATLGVGSMFQGHILAAVSVTAHVASVVYGSLFGLGASVTLNEVQVSAEYCSPAVTTSTTCSVISTFSSSPSSSSEISTSSTSSSSLSTSSSAPSTSSSFPSSSSSTPSSTSSSSAPSTSSSVVTTSSTSFSISSTSSSAPTSTSSSLSSLSSSVPSSSCSVGPRPSNIVPDPSFEDTSSTAWHFISSSVTSTESISGLYSAELTGNDGAYSIVYDFIPYSAYWGDTLYLSYAAKFTGDSNALCYFQALTGSSTIQEVDNLVTSDWQYYTATYAIPQGDESEGFAFALMCGDPSALLYIDDIYFGPSASAPASGSCATSISSSIALASISSSSAAISTSSSAPTSSSSVGSSSTSSSSAPSSTSSSVPSLISSSAPTSSSSAAPSSTSSSITLSSSVSTSPSTTTSSAYTGPPTPSIVPSALNGNCVYMGCYTEALNSRALNSDAFYNYNVGTGMTVEMCAAYCGNNYEMFGVEYSGECYCGNTLQTGSVVRPGTECDMTCDGAPLEFCGGPDRLNVYSCGAIVGTSSSVNTLSATPSTTASPTASSTPISNPAFPDVGSFSYYGCQTEGAFTRALSAKMTAYDSMTLESCAADCTGYAYFGTEYGRECYCGNSFATGSQPVPQDECTFPCAGNGAEVCGAGLRLSVYSTTVTIVTPVAAPTPSNPATVGAYEYYSCMTEGTNSRALQGFTTAYDSMTLESCAADCAGFQYFGTEYSRECYCGNSFSAGAVPAPESQCQNTNFLCMGNPLEFCGGSMILSVYTLAP